jgi:hypothetical protein
MGFIKGGHLQENVAALRHLGPDVEARVRTRAARIISQIGDYSRVDWVPIALDLEWVHAVAEVGGVESVRAFNTHALMASASGPLLRPIRDTAMKLLGNRPEALLRFGPQAWNLIFKDVGTAAFEVTPEGGTLTVSNLPPEVASSRVFGEGVAGALDAVIQIAGARGSFKVTVEPDQRAHIYVGRWSKPD